MEKRVQRLRLGAPLKTETWRSKNGRPARVSRNRLIHRRKLVASFAEQGENPSLREKM